MSLTRRDFLSASGAALGAASLGLSPTWARAGVQLGAMQIDSLSDGHLSLPMDLITAPAPQDQLAAVLEARSIDRAAPYKSPLNITLLRDGERVVLFDTGSGQSFQSSAGELVDALEALDLSVADVTHVVFTHAHPDHLWGVLDEFDDPLFYEAQHMIGKAEWDYWTDPNTVDSIGSDRTTFAVGAQRRLEAVEDSISFFNDGEEILPGVAARATFGHTPGHMSFELRSGSESLMVVGDAIANDFIGFAHPEWHSGTDQDMELGAKTRAALLDQMSSEKMLLLGYHLPDGGIGRAEKNTEGGYRFLPA